MLSRVSTIVRPLGRMAFSSSRVALSKSEVPPNPTSAFSPSSSPKTPNTNVDKKKLEDTSEAAPEVFELPDLTKGIPSTFELEQLIREKAARGQKMDDIGAELGKALTAVKAAEGAGGDKGKNRSGGDSGGEYKSSAERKQEAVAKYSMVLVGLAVVAGAGYMGRNWETPEEINKHRESAPNGFGPLLWYQRASARLSETMTYYQEPAFDKLLPVVDPALRKPYTLVMSLEDLLVHSEWDRKRGWLVAKRPGVDYFLRYLSQYYELVLFTSVPSMNALPTVQKLDPFQFIMFPLFKEATKYEDGEIVKDLSYLNRDLSKVIVIDTNPRHLRKQPENAIILPKWTGSPRDTGLVDLVPFLEYLATMQTSDVRRVLKSFEGKNIPEEFALREAKARAEFQKQLVAKKGRSGGGGGGGGLNIGGLLGMKGTAVGGPLDEINPAEAFAQGKMLHDIARERGQRYYAMLEKDLRENGERYLKEVKEAMEKQQAEAMNSMMGSFGGMFTGDEKK